MKVKIVNIRKSPKNDEDYYLDFEYLGKEKSCVYNRQIQNAIKVEKSLYIGTEIEVLKSIKTSYKFPHKAMEFFKLIKVY